MTKRFTGWHMTAILIAFFGVIIAVNVTMATFATRTFGGVVVENSYVASQKFNGWLATAKAQERLGWTSNVALDGGRHVAVSAEIEGSTLPGVSASAVARHPLGRAPDLQLHFRSDADGHLRSIETLPAGRWLVHLDLRRGSDTVRLIRSLS